MARRPGRVRWCSTSRPTRLRPQNRRWTMAPRRQKLRAEASGSPLEQPAKRSRRQGEEDIARQVGTDAAREEHRRDALSAYLDERVAAGYRVETRGGTQAIIAPTGVRSMLGPVRPLERPGTPGRLGGRPGRGDRLARRAAALVTPDGASRRRRSRRRGRRKRLLERTFERVESGNGLTRYAAGLSSSRSSLGG